MYLQLDDDGVHTPSPHAAQLGRPMSQRAAAGLGDMANPVASPATGWIAAAGSCHLLLLTEDPAGHWQFGSRGGLTQLWDKPRIGDLRSSLCWPQPSCPTSDSYICSVLKCEYPQNHSFQYTRMVSFWMIWGYPHFRTFI